MGEGNAIAPVSDETLFACVAAGDAVAFATFYDRYEALWFTLALRILQDPVEAEDVLQDAAVLLWERAPQYDPSGGRPLSWCTTLVRNKAIDRLRANRRRGDLLERAADEMVVIGRVDQIGSRPGASSGDAAEIVRRTLHTLPAEQRQAIELAFFGGLTQTEIASQLGHPLGTVKARIRRGMIAMRDALEGAL
jgi:RNA polymerase sigma-70 factor (ECF subfamily)